MNSLCPSQFQSLCNLTPDKSGTIVGNVITVILILGAILSLLFLIWGGIRWIMSGGDKAKIDQARATIIAAIVGLIISFLAFFIASVILQIFTGQGLKTLSIPTLVP